MKVRLLTEDMVFTEYPRNEVDIKLSDDSVKTYFVDNRKILHPQNSILEIEADISRLEKLTNNIEKAFIYWVKNNSERSLIKEINIHQKLKNVNSILS